jgi:hypothetical protein
VTTSEGTDDETGRAYDMRVARWMRPILAACGMGRRRTRIALTDSVLRVRAGIWFRVQIDRQSVRRVSRERDVWWAIGVHTDLRSRWLVNGSPRNIVALELDPPARGRMAGIAIKVRRLGLSLEDPERFISAWPPDVRA